MLSFYLAIMIIGLGIVPQYQNTDLQISQLISFRFRNQILRKFNNNWEFPLSNYDLKVCIYIFHLYSILTVNQNLLYILNCREDFMASSTKKSKIRLCLMHLKEI